MEKEQLKTLKEKLSTPKEVVIIPHKNPDGDALGSTLGLCHFLKDKGHSARVISPTQFASFLEWIPGVKDLLVYEDEVKKSEYLLQNAGLIFTLDFNTLSRTGAMARVLEKIKGIPFVMIDHHEQPGDYAQFMYSEPSASSTCEMVYNFIDQLGECKNITPEIATCLYVGIMTDTGSFRFPSTSSQTHRVIAQLIDKGAKNAQIHQAIYDSKSPGQLKLLGIALKNLRVMEGHNTTYITLSQEELDRCNYQKGDTEGIVNYGLSLKGIVFTAIFIEHAEEGIIKISLRSKGDFDVNTFARKHFHGGGHLNAAGGRSEQSLSATAAYFEEVLKDYQNELKK